MSGPRRVALAVLAALAAALTGCGTGSDEERIRAVVADLQSALDELDAERACALLTAAGREHVAAVAHSAGGSDPIETGKTCVTELPAIARSLRGERRATPLPAPEVRRVAVDGASATAVLEVADGIRIVVPFATEDGEWRADALFGDIPGARQEDKYR